MTDMYLVESTIIDKNNEYFNNLIDLCVKAKNLYNATLYDVRQAFFETGKYKSFAKVNSDFIKENNPDYRALNSHIAQFVQRRVDSNFKSFFSNNLNYKSGKSDIKPNIPNYKDKDGLMTVRIPKKAVNKSKREGYIGIGYPKGDNTLTEIKTAIPYKDAVFIEIIPIGNHLRVNVGYKKEVKEIKTNNKYAAIDLGVDNLITMVSNVSQPLIINGKPVKSINQYYNKKLAEKKSQLEDGIYTSKSIRRLSFKRNNKINDYFHKASNIVVNYLVSNDIRTLYIGKNVGWKQNTNMGKKNNQKFVYIPFNNLVDMIKYKAKLNGIKVVVVEESYTSKASFIHQDFIPTYNPNSKKTYKFSGYRKTRGNYVNKGDVSIKEINADINGALNILRKSMKRKWNDKHYQNCIDNLNLGILKFKNVA